MRNCIDVWEIMRRDQQPERGGFSRDASEGRSYKRLSYSLTQLFFLALLHGEEIIVEF